MSDPQTRPIPVGVTAPAGAAADTGGDVLARADGVQLLGEVPGSGYRRSDSGSMLWIAWMTRGLGGKGYSLVFSFTTRSPGPGCSPGV